MQGSELSVLVDVVEKNFMLRLAGFIKEIKNSKGKQKWRIIASGVV